MIFQNDSTVNCLLILCSRVSLLFFNLARAIIKYSGGETDRQGWLRNLFQRKTRARKHVAFVCGLRHAATSPILSSFIPFVTRDRERETENMGKIIGLAVHEHVCRQDIKNILSTYVSFVIDNSVLPLTLHFHSTKRADRLLYFVLLIGWVLLRWIIPETREIIVA